MYNLRNLLRNHLYNVEFVQVLCSESFEPVTYSYVEIFTNSIFTDYLLDDSKVNWYVYTDGLGSSVLRISPRKEL